MNRSGYLFDTFGKMWRADSPVGLESLVKRQVLQDLEKFGVLAFRGFESDLDSFVKFSDGFASQSLKHGMKSLRKNISNNGTVADVLSGEGEVHLHGEMYYLPRRPDLLWFFCQQPAAAGGATTVCDGVELLNALSPQDRKTFENQKLLYRHRWNAEGWQAIFNTDVPEEVLKLVSSEQGTSKVRMEGEFLCFDFATSAIRKAKFGSGAAFVNSLANIVQYSSNQSYVEVRFENGQPVPQSLVDRVNEIGEDLTHNMNWQRGDILMIDNSRIMHGRRSFNGTRKISVRFSKGA